MSTQEHFRISKATPAFTTRRVPAASMRTILSDQVRPEPGNLVLARVDRLGHHKRIERVDGRRAHLFPGDEIILAYGNRYAPDQFEAEVPVDMGPCHMVAAGGIAARALSWHGRISRPTSVTPIGIIGDHFRQPINIHDFALTSTGPDEELPSVVVAGTSMNAGKTTTAARIIHGLSRAGYRVGGMKLTGTGAGGDLWLMNDAGAHCVMDFTDAGFPSTYRSSLTDLHSIYQRLLPEFVARGCDSLVIEIADGLYQSETRMLLESETFRLRFPHIVFAAAEAMGAENGIRWLQELGYDVRGLSGQISRSPLAMQEAGLFTDVPTWDIRQLEDEKVALGLLTSPIARCNQAVNQ